VPRGRSIDSDERMFEATVLGVDPGLARAGLAVVGVRDRRASLVWAKAIETPADLPEAARLARIAEGVSTAIAEHRPRAVALERVAWNRNQVSALQVARATGAVMVAAARAGLLVEEYGPNEVKIAITGSGNAGKDQVRLALVRIHGLRGLPDQPDAVDAAAVALTHVFGSTMRAVARAGAR
jgi:crossover junction endodeoxyribonuclease RuvC